jgi:hypothetical protein
MRYLGRISGNGILKRSGENIARAAYDFEGFMDRPARLVSSGEIRLPAAALESVFGCKDIQLLTDDGRVLDLKFADKKLPLASQRAVVDVSGELPKDALSWHH